MADDLQPKSGGGCLAKLVTLILLAGFLGLGTGLFFVTQPQDLDDLTGNDAPVSTRDLAAVLKNSVDRGYAVTLDQAEINQWLGRTLEAKQAGLLAGQVDLERVWVRLEEGVAEIIMERRVMGRVFTVSMFLMIEQTEENGRVLTQVHLHGGKFAEAVERPMRGGRFGKLVVPQGFLVLVLPAYQKLVDVFSKEIYLVEEMSRIRIGNGRLVLDPRIPADGGSGVMPEAF